MSETAETPKNEKKRKKNNEMQLKIFIKARHKSSYDNIFTKNSNNKKMPNNNTFKKNVTLNTNNNIHTINNNRIIEYIHSKFKENQNLINHIKLSSNSIKKNNRKNSSIDAKRSPKNTIKNIYSLFKKNRTQNEEIKNKIISPKNTPKSNKSEIKKEKEHIESDEKKKSVLIDNKVEEKQLHSDKVLFSKIEHNDINASMKSIVKKIKKKKDLSSKKCLKKKENKSNKKIKKNKFRYTAIRMELPFMKNKKFDSPDLKQTMISMKEKIKKDILEFQKSSLYNSSLNDNNENSYNKTPPKKDQKIPDNTNNNIDNKNILSNLDNINSSVSFIKKHKILTSTRNKNTENTEDKLLTGGDITNNSNIYTSTNPINNNNYANYNNNLVPGVNNLKKIIYSDLHKNKNKYKNNNDDLEQPILFSKTVRRFLNREQQRDIVRKKLIYDSMDDEEIEDIQSNTLHIVPNSTFIICFDFFIAIISIIFIFSIPLNMAKNTKYCIQYYYSFENLIIFFSELLYIIDFFISFFRSYYNFEELLIKNYSRMILHNLQKNFIIDLLAGIPYLSIFILKTEKCSSSNIKISSIKNYDYPINKMDNLLSLLKLIKIVKLFNENAFINYLMKYFSETFFIEKYGKISAYISIVTVALHFSTCTNIFIGRNVYPSWILRLNFQTKDFFSIYISSLYYIIATFTTVGYGDITGDTLEEHIFHLFLLLIGSVAYSWMITSASNYIKKINERHIEYDNKIKILEEIKLANSNIPNGLYEKILRYLNYGRIHIKTDHNKIFNLLPYSLKNTLIYEMHKNIINNFTIFKITQNSDFVARVVTSFKPFSAIKNDLIVHLGDFIEDMIFIKKGNLAIEICIDIENLKESVKTYLSDELFVNDKYFKKFSNNDIFKKDTSSTNIMESKIFHRNVYRDSDVIKFNSTLLKQPTKVLGSMMTLNNKNKKISNLDFSELRRYDNTTRKRFDYIKVIDIRENEHFGDVLMFLGQRSPLNVRVRSKKIELFFLKKIDAIDISVNYQNIWKRINKKSLYNMEQLKIMIQKAVKVYCNLNGIKLNKYKYFSSSNKTSNKSITNNNISSIEISLNDDNNKTIKEADKEMENEESSVVRTPQNNLNKKNLELNINQNNEIKIKSSSNSASEDKEQEKDQNEKRNTQGNLRNFSDALLSISKSVEKKKQKINKIKSKFQSQDLQNLVLNKLGEHNILNQKKFHKIMSTNNVQKLKKKSFFNTKYNYQSDQQINNDSFIKNLTKIKDRIKNQNKSSSCSSNESQKINEKKYLIDNKKEDDKKSNGIESSETNNYIFHQKEKNISTIINNSIRNVDKVNKNENDQQINNLTTFKVSEINNEIYSGESFPIIISEDENDLLKRTNIIQKRINSNSKKNNIDIINKIIIQNSEQNNYLTNDIKSINILRKGNNNLIINNNNTYIRTNDNININNITKKVFQNISISKNFSVEYKSIYENLNKITKNKYSNLLDLQQKTKKFLLKEILVQDYDNKSEKSSVIQKNINNGEQTPNISKCLLHQASLSLDIHPKSSRNNNQNSKGHYSNKRKSCLSFAPPELNQLKKDKSPKADNNKFFKNKFSSLSRVRTMRRNYGINKIDNNMIAISSGDMTPTPKHMKYKNLKNKFKLHKTDKKISTNSNKMYNQISQNIIQGSQKMYCPEEYYSDFFNNIIKKKKSLLEKTKIQNNNKDQF